MVPLEFIWEREMGFKAAHSKLANDLTRNAHLLSRNFRPPVEIATQRVEPCKRPVEASRRCSHNRPLTRLGSPSAVTIAARRNFSVPMAAQDVSQDCLTKCAISAQNAAFF